MRMKDYYRLGWDQLKRRKVVTALCAMGIAIGSASIIVALSFGESLSHYSELQMGQWLKMDELAVTSGYIEQPDGQGKELQITEQMLEMIRSLPGVQAAAPVQNVNYYSFEVDETKSGSLELFATALSTLSDFGVELHQGHAADMDNAIILNYAATVDLYDERTAKLNEMQGGGGSPRRDQSRVPIPYPLYQKTIELSNEVMQSDGSIRTVKYPLRVVGIMEKPDGLPNYMLGSQKQAYVSLRTAELIQQAFAQPSGGNAILGGNTGYTSTRVKVSDLDDIPAIEAAIRKMKLNVQSNLYQKERMGEEMMIVRLVFGGVGLFILFVASLTIVVAMTMATHQRRRQIGIMKVLGANLRQIRNMFIVESSLLGVIGGMIGIGLSYWVIWTINIVVIRFSGQGAGSEVLFISLWVLPIGFFFALMTGVLSGLYPAIKASKTDALTAIKRE